ncbi:MAG TPA: GAF domain-containing sensor histidine kinase [Candidatus Dormibacteraeota bacterium]|nr:GAF domain-containing sensor histidine kinase [Candidatus Dormibacteraeota bacterium]
MDSWLVRRPRAVFWVICGLALGLILVHSILLYLDRNAGLQGRGALYEPVNLATAIAGGLVISRQPKNAIGWMLAFSGLANLVAGQAQDYSVYANIVQHSTAPGGRFSAWLGSWIWQPGITLMVTFVLLLFPDGRLPTQRWRPVAWLSAATVAVSAVGLAVGSIPRSNFAVDSSGVITDSTRLADTQGLSIFAFIMGLACLAGLLVRFRRSRGQERQQLKWFAFGGVVFAFGLVLAVTTVLGPGHSQTPDWAAKVQEFTAVAVPVAIAIAVLKYRLYDIDLVISRTLVYGSLAAFITAVYVGIVVGVGTLVGSRGQPNLVLSIVATAIVAVAFQPVRERLQRIANRLVYGKRATPYEVLSQFSERVAETYAADEALPRMARVLAEGTGAERAMVWLRSGAVLSAAAAWPPLPSVNGGSPLTLDHTVVVAGQDLPTIDGADRAVAVRHQGELLGALSVTKRAGEPLTPIEDKLLDDLAHQAGLVLKNVGLTAELLARLEDLRASRKRLVAAQDEERRRLERNLHDGAQQNLVALKVKLGLAEMFAEKDPARAKATLNEIKADADEALDTLRDLARGIYPPLLADRGLAAALEAQGRKAPIPVEVRADGVQRYPEDVEAALYFCCLEALQNIAKYAHATTATVRLSASDRELIVMVEDNGGGFDIRSTTKGSGLQNMEDRLDALGGTIDVASEPGSGTRITARIPVRATTVTA